MFTLDYLKVASTTSVYANSAERAFEQFASDETARCLQESYRGLAEEDPVPDVELGDITAGELSFPILGDRSRAYRVAVELTGEGMTVESYLDVLYIQRGRGVAALTFYDVLTPFDRDLEVELAERVASRMDQAL